MKNNICLGIVIGILRLCEYVHGRQHGPITLGFTTGTETRFAPLDMTVKGYNERCDWKGPSDPCDSSRGLVCNYPSGACACWDFRNVFSAGKGRCVGKAGEECVISEAERMCTENAHCLEDQTLSAFPLCLCNKGFFKSDNGTCLPKSGYGDFCSDFPTKQACAMEAGLKCLNYTCQCAHPEDQKYDPRKDKCIAFAGKKCSKSLQNCIENSECSEKIWAYDYEVGETKMIGHTCACKPGLKVTAFGTCAADYGGSCNSTAECYSGQNLLCIDGKCQCSPLSQQFDMDTRRCVGLVGAKCNSSDVKVPGCVEHATCSEGLCKCVNGSSETPMRTCLLDHSQPCKPLRCNIFDGLACLNDKCQCLDPQLKYDENMRACVSSVGASCGKVKAGFVGHEDIKELLIINCETNATCVENLVNGKLKHVCVSTRIRPDSKAKQRSLKHEWRN